MNNSDDEDTDYWNAAERHSQIREEGSRFLYRLGWGIVGVIVVVSGLLAFLIWR